jgi:predicted nucleic acid-binding protein
MVIMDATALLMLLDEKTAPPKDPSTNKPITDAHKRIEHAVSKIREGGEKILIAAPVLAELVVKAENAASQYVHEFNQSAHFKPVPFDQKAALEHGKITRKAVESGNKKDGVDDTLAKIKFDRQIVAIAKAEGVHTIYTDDGNLATHAEKQGIKVVRTHEIVIPQKQATLFDAIEVQGNSLEEKLKGETVVKTVPPSLMPDSPA